MVFPAAYLLVVGGLCACAPLFKRISNALGRLLSLVGFFVGIAVIVVAADIALKLNLLTNWFGSSSAADLAEADPILRYYIPVMIVLGFLLFSRPIRNIRWASLMGLAAGLLVSYYVRLLFPGLTTEILAIVFLIATLAIYTLLRFVEDIFEFVGTVLAFPPIAIGIGLVAVYFGMVIATLP